MKALLKKLDKVYPNKHMFIEHRVILKKDRSVESFRLFANHVTFIADEPLAGYTPKYNSLKGLKDFINLHIDKVNPKVKRDT